MSPDGHILGPIEDQKQESQRADPAFIITDAPPFPSLSETTGLSFSSFGNFLPQSLYQAVVSATEDVLQNVKINGVSPSVNGRSFEFEIPTPQTPFIAPIQNAVVIMPRGGGEPASGSIDAQEDAVLKRFVAGVSSNGFEQASAPVFAPTPALTTTEAPAPAPVSTEVPVTPTTEAPAPAPAPTEVPVTPRTRTPEPTPLVEPEEEPEEVDAPVQDPRSDPKFESFEDQVVGGMERERGESRRDFKERLQEVRDALNLPEVAAAIANGDTTFFNSTFVPVLLTRADGERQIISYLLVDHSFVTEGAVGNEKTGDLPPDNAYYLSGEGGAGGFAAFRIVITKELNAEDPPVETYHYTIDSKYSTIVDGTNGPPFSLPAGTFDSPRELGGGDTFVALEADIDSNYDVLDWNLVEATDLEEVEFNENDVQNLVRLVIGKISWDGVSPPVVEQYTWLPQILEFGFLNGAAVKVFTPHPAQEQ